MYEFWGAGPPPSLKPIRVCEEQGLDYQPHATACDLASSARIQDYFGFRSSRLVDEREMKINYARLLEDDR